MHKTHLVNAQEIIIIEMFFSLVFAKFFAIIYNLR